MDDIFPVNVLLIEDNEDDIYFINKSLRSFGYQVSTITTGDVALQYLRNPIEIPDVVLLDYHLPFKNGFEILSELQEKVHEYAFIFLSNDDSIEIIKNAMRAGAYDFISKKYELKSQLHSVIQKVYKIQKNIKDKQKIEIQLQKSQNNFATYIEAAPTAIFVLDHNFAIKFVNTSTKTLLQIDDNQIVGRNIADFILMTDSKHFALSEIFPRSNIELILKKSNNSPIYVISNSFVVENDIVVFCTDITENVNTKTKLRIHDELIKDLQEGISSKVGVKFFETIVQQLAKTLQADYTFIGELNANELTTISIYHRNERIENFSYIIEDTPCNEMIDSYQCYSYENCQQLFPKSFIINSLEINVYVGTPLFDSHQNRIGVLVVLFKKTNQNIEFAEKVLKLFSGRAGAEFERKKTEESLLTLNQMLNSMNEEYIILNEELEESNAEIEYQNHIIRQNEEKLHLALIGGGKYIWQYDVPSQNFYCNPDFYKYLGYCNIESEKISYKEWLQFLHPEGVERVSSVFENCLFGKVARINIAHQVKKFDGRLIWISIQGMVSKRGDNQSIILISGTITDITERKEAENALKASLETFRTLTKNLPDAIMRFDKNAQLLFNNNKLQLFYDDKSKYEISSKQVSNENLNSFLKNKVENVFSTRQTVEDLFEIPTLLGIKILDWRFVPEFNEQNEVRSVMGIARDVTDQKQFESELIKAKNKAEESDRLKSAFLANMSHEIRTPMNSIIGFSQMLVEEDVDLQHRKSYIDIIKSSCSQQLSIINDIIDISRIESGTTDLHNAQTNISQLVDEIYQQYSQTIDKPIRIDIQKDSGFENLILETDEVKLKQIINNLITNAIKFTHQGVIVLGYSVKNDVVEFYVSDTGIGIAKENFELIFERFRRVEHQSHETYRGNGLGLAITKSYVELMDGKIWLESKKDQGTTFYFTIPYIPKSYHEINKIPEPELDKKAFRGKTILIAEDEDVNFKLMLEVFQTYEVTILRAKNGFVAIEEALLKPYINLILMDLKMPEMDGFEATKEIKKIRNELPIIALTAYAFSENKITAANAGFDDYIVKPIAKDLLISKIYRFL